MKTRRIDWLGSIPFFLMHLSLLLVLFVPFHIELLILCVGSYYLRMFGITAGFHRYFSHRSYRMGRISQFLMAFLGCTAAQKGPLWWAAHHRWHHRFSDQPQDLHSPVQHGFWWAHVGWILSFDYNKTNETQIPDLIQYPELKFLNRFHLIPAILYAWGIYLFMGMSGLIWGFLVSTVLLWHGTFTINSLSHVFGKARYRTTDTSKNNPLLALITLGEGWHNNHHCYMSSTRQGFFWWEIDITYYLLKVLSWIKIVSDFWHPPLHLLDAKRILSSAQDPSIKHQAPFPHIQTSTPLRAKKVQLFEHA